MDNTKTNTRIRNIILAIVGIPMTIIMASEISNPDYWWIQAVAAIVVFIVVKIALGGNENEWHTHRR